MRLYVLLLVAALSVASPTFAAQKPAGTSKTPATSPDKDPPEPPRPIEVTADQTLEWYQDQRMYVARGHARAVRNDMVVDADTLTAHEKEKPTAKDGADAKAAAKAAAKTAGTDSQGGGDLDKLVADGHVVVTDPKSRTLGDHAVYDLVAHTMVMTGKDLRYETEKETVFAKDSLEYYEDKKIAVARGHAVEEDQGRHVEGDILTAEFTTAPNGENQMNKVTAVGNVTVVTKSDVATGDKGVYDTARNIAIITGNVHITRPDGTELTGDVGEVDFVTNQSRLLNSGHGRVRALLPPKTTEKATSASGAPASAKGSLKTSSSSVSSLKSTTPPTGIILP